LIPNLITPTSLIHINFTIPEFKSIQAPLEILYTHGITHNITFRIQNNPSTNQKSRKPVPCNSPPGEHSTLPGGSTQNQEQHCPLMRRLAVGVEPPGGFWRKTQKLPK